MDKQLRRLQKLQGLLQQLQQLKRLKNLQLAEQGKAEDMSEACDASPSPWVYGILHALHMTCSRWHVQLTSMKMDAKLLYICFGSRGTDDMETQVTEHLAPWMHRTMVRMRQHDMHVHECAIT